MIRIIVVEMCMLVSGVISPIGLGWVIDRIGYAFSLLIVVGLSSLNFVYVFFFLPNTDDRKHLESDKEARNSASATVQ